ncbi:VOC family protein [Natronosporangium hydrolyticum]|uniref:VOC family protein n=1 Tax=Natronosporangium hydrolyticum TaxID=2811111 RepID=A0A895YE81_9ACTN|nr:VOC family protein [Natronosporangium hydrolyticum]QSB16144.1 VOC family protein [Natronosporangium hydrolyticum]
MQQITTCLWFDHQAEAAANYYCSLFEDARIVAVQRTGEAGPGEPGSALLVTFELAGQRFFALNGGGDRAFSEAISLHVNCRDQAEVDHFWDRFIADGGEESLCGWLKDRYGVSWQIVPEALPTMLADPDPARAGRVMQAMLQMRKLDLPELTRAYEGA